MNDEQKLAEVAWTDGGGSFLFASDEEAQKFLIWLNVVVDEHKAEIAQARTDERKAVIDEVNDKICNLMGWEESPEYDRGLEELRTKLQDLKKE